MKQRSMNTCNILCVKRASLFPQIMYHLNLDVLHSSLSWIFLGFFFPHGLNKFSLFIEKLYGSFMSINLYNAEHESIVVLFLLKTTGQSENPYL